MKTYQLQLSTNMTNKIQKLCNYYCVTLTEIVQNSLTSLYKIATMNHLLNGNTVNGRVSKAVSVDIDEEFIPLLKALMRISTLSIECLLRIVLEDYISETH